MQFKEKLMSQTSENGKKTNFGHGIVLSLPKIGPQNVFSWVLPLLDVIQCWKLSLYANSRKTNEANLKKWQKT